MKIFFASVAFVAVSAFSIGAFAADPAHLTKARAFVDNTKPENNLYGSPVVLVTGNSYTPFKATVQCNSFLNEDLKASYGWNLYSRFGSTSPTAEKWFDLVNSGKNQNISPFSMMTKTK